MNLSYLLFMAIVKRMFFESLWANLTYLLSYVDPIINRNTKDDKTLWQGFFNSSMQLSNNAFSEQNNFVHRTQPRKKNN